MGHDSNQAPETYAECDGILKEQLAMYQKPCPMLLQIGGCMSCGPPIYMPCDSRDAIGIEESRGIWPNFCKGGVISRNPPEVSTTSMCVETNNDRGWWYNLSEGY